MSDGPLPESTGGVDSSPEGIADIVKRLRPPDDDSAYIFTLRDFLRDAAAVLAQVARERDEAVERITRWRAENGGRYWEARFRDEEIRAVAAERQLAEARAAIDDLSRAVSRDLRAEGEWQAADARKRLYEAQSKARALLSGETT